MCNTRSVPRSTTPTIEHARLQTRVDGGFRFGVVADTHSKPHPLATERLRELKPDAILHGGDVGDLSVLGELTEIAPLLAVRGNIDVQARELPELLTVEVLEGTSSRLRLLLVHIAVYGVRLRAEVARRAVAERASLVVCGHSHVPFIGRDRGIGLFNPGSVGPRRFGLPIVLGSIELSRTGVRLQHIDCETGNVWTPPQLPSLRRD